MKDLSFVVSFVTFKYFRSQLLFLVCFVLFATVWVGVFNSMMFNSYYSCFFSLYVCMANVGFPQCQFNSLFCKNVWVKRRQCVQLMDLFLLFVWLNVYLWACFSIIYSGSLFYWLNICCVCVFCIQSDRFEKGKVGFDLFFTFNNRGNIVISLAYLWVCLFVLWKSVKMGPAFVVLCVCVLKEKKTSLII